MTRNRLLTTITVVMILGLGLWLRPWAREVRAGAETQGAQAGKKERKVLYWVDPMNPARRFDKPGKMADGMDLMPVYEDGDAAASMPAGTVKIDATRQQLIGVTTAKVVPQPIQRTIRTVAQLEADETKIAHIHVKVRGWIHDVYVDFVGKLVKKGDPLFTLYSPDLVSTQQEYLVARRGRNDAVSSDFPEVRAGAESLLEASRERLRLWDISDDQIRKLDETGKVIMAMTFYSPATGFVLDRKAYPHVAVSPDTELYMLADLSTIWAVAQIYEYEVPYVRLGQSARMQLSYVPGKTYRGRVTWISPMVDPQTRTVKVRLEFANPGFELKPQMFSKVELAIDYGKQIAVPVDAVLDSGTEQIVFVAHEGGYFEPRKVQIGSRLEDRVIILSGLKPGETIVTSGNFLIDSESRLKSAVGAMKY